MRELRERLVRILEWADVRAKREGSMMEIDIEIALSELRSATPPVAQGGEG